MNKKIFRVLVYGLLTFALSGNNAIAGEATQVYLEMYKTITYPYDKEPIRARAAFLDSTGNLATTFNNQDIADAELIVRSLNFYEDVKVSSDSYATDPKNLTFISGIPASIDIDSAWQEFALNYDNVPAPGDDVIRVTLNNGSATIFSTDKPLKVIAPVANCYVVRTGGIQSNALPKILEPIGIPQNNYDLPQRAGSSVKLDIFAAYGYDSTGLDGPFDTFIYTNNLPAGAEKVQVEGSEVTLVDGHAATSVQVNNLGISPVGTTSDEQITDLQNKIKDGVVKTYSASSKIIPELGTKCSDVNTDGQIAVCSAGTFGSGGTAFTQDTVLFYPDVLYRVNIVGLPITGVNGEFSGNDTVNSVASPIDAYRFTDWTTRAGTFKVNAPNIYAAVVGFDAYNNPQAFAPATGLVVNMQVRVVQDGATADIPVNGVAFIPLKYAVETKDVHLFSANTSLEAVITASNINTAIKGVDFIIQQDYVTSITPIPSINVEAAKGSITVAIAGTQNESTFSMKVYKKTGGLVRVNRQNVFTPVDSVIIPKSADNFTATQDVIFFTSANDDDLLLIFTGQTNQTVFAYPVAGTIISPADATAFPPSSVTVGISEASVLIDSTPNHDQVNICQFDVKDAFGNSYNFDTTNGKDLEDSKATIAVFKANGTTSFPNAVAKLVGNNADCYL